MLHEPGPRGVLDTLLRSAGEAWEMLSLRATGIRASADSELRRDPVDTLKMHGPELFKIAVKSMADITRQVVERAGVTLADVKLVVPHQANIRILNAVAERLGICPGKGLHQPGPLRQHLRRLGADRPGRGLGGRPLRRPRPGVAQRLRRRPDLGRQPAALVIFSALFCVCLSLTEDVDKLLELESSMRDVARRAL